MMQKLKDDSIIGMKAAWHDKTFYYFLFDYAINGDFSSFLKRNGKYFMTCSLNGDFCLQKIDDINVLLNRLP